MGYKKVQSFEPFGGLSTKQENMAGESSQIQIRHILVDKEEVAELLKETVDAVSTETGRIKMLMTLAGKYSVCSSKTDGGNLGWMELGWNPNDPRAPRGGFKVLRYEDLDLIIREMVAKGLTHKGIVFGPIKSEVGFHLVIISNEYKTNRIL